MNRQFLFCQIGSHKNGKWFLKKWKNLQKWFPKKRKTLLYTIYIQNKTPLFPPRAGYYPSAWSYPQEKQNAASARPQLPKTAADLFGSRIKNARLSCLWDCLAFFHLSFISEQKLHSAVTSFQSRFCCWSLQSVRCRLLLRGWLPICGCLACFLLLYFRRWCRTG